MLANTLIILINHVIQALVTFATSLLNILPNTPFTTQNLTLPETFIGYINWCFPFKQMLVIMGVWLVCIGAYYAVSYAMRITKFTE